MEGRKGNTSRLIKRGSYFMIDTLTRIACLQFEPRVGDLNKNVEKSCHYIEKAHTMGAKIVVLPELCNSGYVFES